MEPRESLAAERSEERELHRRQWRTRRPVEHLLITGSNGERVLYGITYVLDNLAVFERGGGSCRHKETSTPITRDPLRANKSNLRLRAPMSEEG